MCCASIIVTKILQEDNYILTQYLEELMERLSRYGRRMKLTLINTMTVASLVCIIAIPFLTKNLLKTEANYYSITINGMKVGAANTEEEVIVALASARQELSCDSARPLLMSTPIATLSTCICSS